MTKKRMMQGMLLAGVTLLAMGLMTQAAAADFKISVNVGGFHRPATTTVIHQPQVVVVQPAAHGRPTMHHDSRGRDDRDRYDRDRYDRGRYDRDRYDRDRYNRRPAPTTTTTTTTTTTAGRHTTTTTTTTTTTVTAPRPAPRQESRGGITIVIGR